MRTIQKSELGGISLTPFQRHPRMVELRFVFLHGLLVSEYGDETTMRIIKAWCDIHKINYTFLAAILNQKERVKQLNITDKVRFRQEVIFMGHIYNEPREVVGNRYLNISKTFLYRAKQTFDPVNFVTQDWLDELDYNVIVCGVPQYNNEALRFIESIENFLEVVGFVPLAKKKV